MCGGFEDNNGRNPEGGENMDLFRWNEKYDTGIARIDEEHRNLVGLLNGLYRAMRAGKTNEPLEELLDELIDYTRFHFANEESLMSRYGYPGYAAHKLEHERMTQKVQELQEQLAKGRISLSIEVFQFLRNWLSNHILDIDQRYAPFLAERDTRQ
jgi:hemerythrin-like metal-binding protein